MIKVETVERIVETVTRQVLLALADEERRAPNTPADRCVRECAEGLCVQVCMDRVGQIVSAGAERISAGLGAVPADRQLAEMIDHTLLKPDATPDQIAQLCFEARKFGFASVCINSAHVKLAADLLKGSPVKVCTVVGFPLGATPPEVKAYEAQKAIDEGATEVDMVINIGAIKARDYETAARDVRAVARACRASGMVLLKVIIEAALLTDEEKVAACLIAKAAGADFVKTSTGFGPGGATVADVQLMRRVVGPKMGVKAAGGIRTLADAEGLVAAGATRIGASAGVKILQEAAGAKSALKSGGREVLNE